MIISFDLDDTLIPGTKKFETEKQNLIQKICRLEKIRKDTITLMRRLRKDMHILFIYTTSLRKTSSTWFLFFTYGIRIARIINHEEHDLHISGTGITVQNILLHLVSTFI